MWGQTTVYKLCRRQSLKCARRQSLKCRKRLFQVKKSEYCPAAGQGFGYLSNPRRDVLHLTLS